MLKSIITVLTGSLLGQAIALAASPFLSRIYDAEAFGRLQIYLAILNVLLMVVAFRYEMALLSAPPDKSYNKLLGLLGRLQIGVSLLAGVSLLWIDWYFGNLFTDSHVILLLLVPGLFISGFYQSMSFLPMRHKNYALSARSKVAQSATYVFTSLLLAFTPLNAIALVTSDIVSRLWAAVYILRGVPGTLSIIQQPQTPAELMQTAREHHKFPLYSFPGTLVSTIAAALFPFVLTRLYGFEVTGQYALIERFVLVPVGILAGATMQVFNGEFASSSRNAEGNLNAVFRKVVRNLMLVAVVPCLLGMYFAPAVVPQVFGPGWEQAGRFCAILMPIAFVSFVVLPVNLTIVMCGKQNWQLVWEIFRTFLLAGCFLPLCWLDTIEPENVLRIYSVCVCLTYVVFLVLADFATRATKEIVVDAIDPTARL